MKSTFRNNIITLNDVRDLTFESLEIMDNESSAGGLSLFDYETINAELGIEIFFSARNIKMSRSSFSFLIIQQILLSDFSKAINIMFDDF